MNEDDDIQVDESTATAVAEPPQTASEVTAALADIQARLDRRESDIISARDEEWRQYVASQEEPEPDPNAYIDPKAIQSEATKAAVVTMSAVMATQADIRQRAQAYGPEGVKMAEEIIAKSPPETLANRANATMIAGYIAETLRENGKLPTQGVSAGNNGVSGKDVSPDLSAFANATGFDLSTLTVEEKAELRSVGMKA